MRTLLVLATLAIVGCAPTRYPMIFSQSLARTTDRMARDALDALARQDPAKLAQLGAGAPQIQSALAAAPRFAVPIKARFLTDYSIADSYLRYYAVTLADGGEVPVEIAFRDPAEVKLKAFAFPTNQQVGDVDRAGRPSTQPARP